MAQLAFIILFVAVLARACGSSDTPHSQSAAHAAADKSFSCSKTAEDSSREVRDMISQMATVSFDTKNKVVVVTWGSDWDQASHDQRQGLIEAFANADACLNKGARDIQFYRSGTLVGTADYRGIRLH